MKKEKKVMLYSGGLDSRLQLPFIDPDVILYVDLGTQYSKWEIASLNSMLPGKHKKRVIVTPTLNLESFERGDFYLPFRNAILGLLAAQYGQHVYFGFNASDNAPDKDADFLIQLRMLVEVMGRPKYVPDSWVLGKFGYDVTFHSPYRTLTKTEMLHNFLSNNMGTKRLVQDIRTCYSADSKIGCGECAPCAHKAVALINNDIPIEGVFDNPITPEVIQYWIGKHNEWRPGNKVLIDFENAYKRISV